jgi:peptidoglycan hydrolase CwlO-like protein
LQGYRTKDDLQVYNAGVPVDGQILGKTSELKAVEDTVGEVVDTVQGLDTSVDNLNTSVDNLNTSVDNLGGEVETVKEALSDVKDTEIPKLRGKTDLTIYNSEGVPTDNQIASQSWVQTYLSERYENGEATYYGS